MALQFTTKGYSAMGKIGAEKIFLTSYSLAYDNNIIKSNAAVNLMYSSFELSLSSPYKLLPGYVQAEPRFEISISYELKSGDQGSVLSDFTNYLKTTSEKISISDKQKGLNFEFDKCYWTGTTLAVENNSVVTCTKTYIYFDSSFRFVKSSFNNAGIMSGGSCLIPYYNTMTSFDSTMSFSLSIRRNLTPKYGCLGSSSGATPTLYKIIMGLVEISLQITCFLKGHTIRNTQFPSSLTFSIGKKSITFNECCLQSINHNTSDNGTISYSYSVLGRVITK